MIGIRPNRDQASCFAGFTSVSTDGAIRSSSSSSAVATGAAAPFIHAGWVTVGAYVASTLITLPLLARRTAAGPPAAAARPAGLAQTDAT